MQNLSIEGFRLSPQQKRLWEMLHTSSARSYCACFSILIEGNLQRENLSTALQSVIHKHEILRTAFPTLQGMTAPLQVITDTSMSSIIEHDLRRLNPEEQADKLQFLFDEKKQKTFNFEHSSLFEASLITLSSERRLLLICLPALCADKSTLKSLAQAIVRGYEISLDKTSLLDESETLQYADIAEWQNELFEGEEAELGKQFWQNKSKIMHFADCCLDFEYSSTSAPDFKPESLSLFLSADQIEKLEAIAHDYNASTSILLQACWQILLWRLTRQADITVGTYCDGRNYEELEGTLGLLSKYLPVHCHLESTFKLNDILKQINQSRDEVFKWQESFNWEQFIESNGGTPTPFFSACFEFEELSAQYSVADILFSIDKQYVCFEPFKLKLSCVRKRNVLVAEFHYDSNLFQVEDIERLSQQFQTLLESLVGTPEVEVSKLDILSDRDRQQLLIEFNRTRTDYPRHRCVHQLFEDWAVKTPQQTAVVFENQQLTYAQLNARANQLAHHLRGLGVGPETIVALCVERSPEMLVGLLGILKAGGAYLPLDPILPEARLRFMMQDAGVSVIVTQQSLAQPLSGEKAVSIVCLDGDLQEVPPSAADNSACEVTSENLVYVIYTSGSTGKPKGVAVEHQQLLNYLYGILERLDLPEGASFATVSTFAADLGNTAIFPALCTGGCLHVISHDRATNPEALAEYCDRHSIDCLKIVPSHLKALLSAAHPEKILPQTCLILGGEALSWQLIEHIHEYAPGCQILNHYGPTEATVGVLTYRIPNEPMPHQSGTVPLGRAIANTQTYILDRHQHPVPIGVTGELYIGGDNLARGYLNQPELTNERFIHNPFNGRSRLYKTGDLARYRPDGNIEFQGRMDHQVKIHGFRIELSEIESVLKQHPSVQATVVLAREDESSNQRLVAYVVPRQQVEFSVAELRHFLKLKLPDYMTPAAFVRLKALPLTPNGKVDRQALPAPDAVRPELTGQFVAPSNPIEQRIAGIWTQVLGLDRVGVHDNFFELGGDSIMSIQIVSRLNQAGLQLTPKQMFEHPTIAGLATVAEVTQTIAAEQGIVTGSLPLTPIQHWFFEQPLCDPHHWTHSVLLEIRHTIVPDILRKALQPLLRHHDALRLQFVATVSGWQAMNSGLAEAEAAPFTFIDLSSEPADVGVAIAAKAAELQAGLNLAEGPLIRAALFNLGDNRPNRLLIVIHQLAVDAVSWRILLEDLQTAYQQIERGSAVQLPPKTTSFKQWAEFLQEYAQSTELQPARDYWNKIPSQPTSRLPVDNPDGANTVTLASTVSVSLSDDETRALLKEVPEVYGTQVKEVLLTALMQTFKQWTQAQSLLVDLEEYGRDAVANNIDPSRTVGWFTTRFPVMLTLEGILQPGEAIKAIKEQLRKVPNRGIGYGVLRYLAKDAQLCALPQAEVRFNYLGQFDQSLADVSLFSLVSQATCASCNPKSTRHYLLDIECCVLSGQLQLEWTYSEQIYEQSTIRKLATAYIEALRSLISHCQSPDAGGYTVSDFPKAQLSQGDLDKLLAKLNTANGNESE